ncbi:MAG: polysaccharide deacetylase family protein [Acidimicrobiales bacterium]|nr:polysaccharide deacetylase family protein [Acidimicrobiales bacterium]
MGARRWLQRGVKAAAVAADGLRRPPDGVVVLIYHRVGGGSSSEVDLPADRFDQQLAWLVERGRPIALAEAVEVVAGRRPVPVTTDGGPPVAITFDDGTADFAEVAVPLLERHGVPATLYAATEFIDEGRAFPGDAPPVSWAALADACATGLVSVGSHTHRHRLLDRLDPDAVADELDRSIELIGEQLGTAPVDFAYPKAVLGSAAARAAVAQRFRSAAVAGTKANPVGADLQRLARSPIQRGDAPAHVHRKADGGMALEDQLRRLLNRRRYTGATT